MVVVVLSLPTAPKRNAQFPAIRATRPRYVPQPLAHAPPPPCAVRPHAYQPTRCVVRRRSVRANGATERQHNQVRTSPARARHATKPHMACPLESDIQRVDHPQRCRTFDGAAGTCPYGTRCRFIHQPPEPVPSTTDTSIECVDDTPPPPPEVTQPESRQPPATPTWREVRQAVEATALGPPSARRKLVMPAAVPASTALSSPAAAPPPHAPLLAIPSSPAAPTSPSPSLLDVPLRGSQTMRRLPIFQSIASAS